MGTCPGHAEWTRGVIIWGLWEPNGSGSRSINPSGGDEDEPACVNSIGVCIAYDDPSDIEGSQANLLAEQLEACRNLDSAELAALGFEDLAVGSGWTLIHHWCTTQNELDVVYDGQAFVTNGPSVLDSCVGSWDYEGFCSASDCPIDDGGTSTGAVDSSTSGAGAYDCSEVSSSKSRTPRRFRLAA